MTKGLQAPLRVAFVGGPRTDQALLVFDQDSRTPVTRAHRASFEFPADAARGQGRAVARRSAPVAT